MPIRPENKGRYPKNWREISHRIRFIRAHGRCECAGECRRGHTDRCDARHGQPNPITRALVWLTVAHLDHTPEHCDDDNLRAMCQACHLAYDAEHHAETARATRAAQRATWMTPLFDLPADASRPGLFAAAPVLLLATAHTSPVVTVNPRAAALVGGALAAWLVLLRVKSRVSRARLARAVARSFNPNRPGRRPSARAEHRMLTRSARSRRATWRFRKAMLLSSLIAAAWLFVQLHPHAR